MSFFLTGTDTGVGKTFTACAMIREARALGRDCVGLKPICCGDRGDVEAHFAASEGAVPMERINPVWLSTPASPYMASILERRTIDLEALHATVLWAKGTHEQIVVEGAGGWFVPITRDYFVSDFAADLALPVIVVVANRLGALNHTLLTVRAILDRGLTCAGVILNEPAPSVGDPSVIIAGNRMILENLLEVPVLGELGFGARKVEWRRSGLYGSATPLA